MNCIIKDLPAFQIMAACREFSEPTCMVEIPKYWDEYFQQGNGEIACGQFGFCFDYDGKSAFRYGIGNRCVVEKLANGSTVYHIENRPDRTEIPEGFELISVPAYTWAVAECVGPVPKSIQDAWTRLYQEWLPGSGYEKSGFFDMEVYSKREGADTSSEFDYKCSIQIPVRKK